MNITIEKLLQSEYFQSLLILLGSIILAKFFDLVLSRFIKHVTEKTETELDDKVFESIKTPICFLIILAGLFFSLNSLSVLVPYNLWIDRIFFISAVLFITHATVKVMSILVNHWIKVEKKFEKTPQLINKVIGILLYIVAFLVIINNFNIEITPIIASIGLGGLAVGLALQATLSNLFAGLHIITDRPINPGDFIELPELNISGYVEDIGWRSTRLRTLPDQIVIVPNSKLAENTIINNYLPGTEISTTVQVGVDYRLDLRKVEEVTIEVARKIQKTIPGAVKGFEPFIRYHTFGDSNINFSVILRVEKFVDKFLVIHEFIKELKERYDREGIEISQPVRKIYQVK